MTYAFVYDANFLHQTHCILPATKAAVAVLESAVMMIINRSFRLGVCQANGLKRGTFKRRPLQRRRRSWRKEGRLDLDLGEKSKQLAPTSTLWKAPLISRALCFSRSSSSIRYQQLLRRTRNKKSRRPCRGSSSNGRGHTTPN